MLKPASTFRSGAHVIYMVSSSTRDLSPEVSLVNKRGHTDARHAGFERMASEYGNAMLRFAAAQLGGRQLAEDAVQEALIKLYTHE